MVISTKYTHADLLVMPNDGKQRQIVDGELFVTPSPKFTHQHISSRIYLALGHYLETHPIGYVLYAPLDVILSESDVLEPDLLLVLNEHRSILQDWVRGAPDLVVEVLSLSTVRIDRGPKLRAYARFGVPECWLVDPEEKCVELYRLAGQTYALHEAFTGSQSLTSAILPGFSLAVAEIFKLP